MTILPLSRSNDPETVFVLGGGGNLGAVQVGMLRAAVERGIVPDAVVGCSVGAINGAALAGDPTADGVRALAEVWLNLRRNTLGPSNRLSSVRLLRKGAALAPNDGVRSLLETWLPYRTFEEATIPFHVVATSLETGRERWFSSGPVVDPILASAALPGVLPPVEIDGELLVDGGVVDNVPVARALALRPRRVVVFHVGNFVRRRRPPLRPIDVVIQAFSVARNHRFLTESLSISDDVELIVLPGVDPGNLRPTDFGRSAHLMALGHLAAGTHLDGLAVATG